MTRPIVLPTPDPDQTAMDAIEAILVADYPAEESRIRADVARERRHARCSPIWLHDMACLDDTVTDTALERIRDVIDAMPSPSEYWDWSLLTF